jgi:hypothetical protein
MIDTFVWPLDTGYIPGPAARRWACLQIMEDCRGVEYGSGSKPGVGYKLGSTTLGGFPVWVVKGGSG